MDAIYASTCLKRVIIAVLDKSCVTCPGEDRCTGTALKKSVVPTLNALGTTGGSTTQARIIAAYVECLNACVGVEENPTAPTQRREIRPAPGQLLGSSVGPHC